MPDCPLGIYEGVGIGKIHTGTLFTLLLVVMVTALPGGQNPQEIGPNKILTRHALPLPRTKAPGSHSTVSPTPATLRSDPLLRLLEAS